jgi:glycine/D-amino acid oxidase-like deaminating enzyme
MQLRASLRPLRRASCQAAGRCVFSSSPLPSPASSPAWAPPPRAATLARLASEVFDVVVVGGGCVGAGVAWEASTRGLRVALLERGDISAGTSSRSTKLLHGGVRYLEAAVWKADAELFGLVREALAERAHVLHAAPFLASPLPLLVPVASAVRLAYTYAGTKMYDALAGGQAATEDERLLRLRVPARRARGVGEVRGVCGRCGRGLASPRTGAAPVPSTSIPPNRIVS